MNSRPEKIALVTPWFHSGNGGAEVFCGGLARALAGIGHKVEILTTCCRDPFQDWSKNHLRPGEEQLDGITVRRFPVRPRDADLFAHLSRVLDSGGDIAEAQEEEFLVNSINSDDLCRFITAKRDEYLFFFLPYLYGTTFHGVFAAGRSRAFLIPCLHNESFAYLVSMQRMFSRVRGCLFLSEPERDFATGLYDLSRCRHSIIGGGVNPDIRGDAGRFRSARKIAGPFALYAGRKVPGKGADLLLRFFAEYVRMNPGDELGLVLLGGGEIEIPGDLKGRVHSLGVDSAQDIFDGMAACEFLVHPSFYESFSLVMMEAWLHQKPVLVNGECEVTQYHVLRSNAGLYFTNVGEFMETVVLMRSNPGLCHKLGAAGRRYVLEHYQWHDVALRFTEFLDEVRRE
jgi:glycosyltransferase involved in cell wall biosynthesis